VDPVAVDARAKLKVTPVSPVLVACMDTSEQTAVNRMVFVDTESLRAVSVISAPESAVWDARKFPLMNPAVRVRTPPALPVRS